MIYYILDIERYKAFREGELDIAHMKAMKDIQSGNYKTQTAQEHIKELIEVLMMRFIKCYI